MLAFHRLDVPLGSEPGRFDVYIGGDSMATQRASFALTEALRKQ